MYLAAYADESYDLDLGVYVLTASLIDQTEAEPIRAVLRELRSGHHKVHWYKSSERRRLTLIGMASKVAYFHVTVGGRGTGVSAERARRKCLESLLVELAAMKIDHLMLESRQHRDDLRDQQLVMACRRKRLLPHGLHVGFTPGEAEPLLWLPDTVCGAVLAAERGNPIYLAELGDASHVITISTGEKGP